MKKLYAALLLVAAVVIGLLLSNSTADAVTPPACSTTALVTSASTTVTADPDSGNHGDWANDNFVRITEIYNNCDGTYRVNVHDLGHFTTLAGAPSPGAGLPLPGKPITGTFEGSDTFIVTSATDPSLTAPPTITGGPSTSTWPSRFFLGNSGSGGAWSWTYKYCFEQWVDASTGTPGDILGSPLCNKPAKPPTSTVTAPPTTVVQPVPGPTKVVTVTNPGQFSAVPNTAKGVNTGDGSLS